MAVRIRLTRRGARKKPFYRIVAADSEFRRDGKFLEILGTYDPKTDPPRVILNKDRIEHWLKVGAKPTNTVKSLLRRYGS